MRTEKRPIIVPYGIYNVRRLLGSNRPGRLRSCRPIQVDDFSTKEKQNAVRLLRYAEDPKKGWRNSSVASIRNAMPCWYGCGSPRSEWSKQSKTKSKNLYPRTKCELQPAPRSCEGKQISWCTSLQKHRALAGNDKISRQAIELGTLQYGHRSGAVL